MPAPAPSTPDRDPHRVDELLADARRRLDVSGAGPPREAHLLLAHILGWSEAQVLARGERRVAPPARRAFELLLERRLHGEPVAYLLGEREFYGRAFRVDRRVLIPRPETEHAVEAALALPLPPRPRVLDIGTGSGCIACTIALERPDARVVASDISPAALAVASGNARRLGSGVAFVACDLDAALSLAAFDLVVSNPPYIGLTEAPGLAPDVVEFEPHAALFSPGESDTILRLLLERAHTLRPGSFLILETGFDQAERLADALAPGLLLRELRRDYAGIPRTLVLERR